MSRGLGREHRLVPPDKPERVARPGTFRRVLSVFRPYRAKLTLVAFLILIASGLGLVNPLLIKVVFDDVILAPGDPGERLRLLLLVVAAMIFTPLFAGAFNLWQTYTSNVVGANVMQDLRNSLYAHLQQMPLKFFTSTRTGEIQSRLSNDIEGIHTVVSETASTILSSLTIVVSTIIAMFILSWQLALLSLGVLPLFVLLSHRVGRLGRDVSGRRQESLADLTALLQETLSVSGVLLARAFGRQSYEINRFRRENERLSRLNVRQMMVGRGFSALIHAFFSMAPAFVYLLAGYLVLRGHVPGDPRDFVGTIVAFTTLQSRLFFPLGQILNMNVEVHTALALFDRVFEYLDLERDIMDRDGAIELTKEEVRGEVGFRDVWFRYDRQLSKAGEERRLWTIAGVDFTVRPGELVALVGPSGAGKTTLTYLLPRLYDVNRGSVQIDGIDVRDIRLESIGEIIGTVTQETYLFNQTVRENLRYGNPDAGQEEIETAAKAAHIYERIMRLPDGFDTVVGERGYKLSGGEKQRLAMARVLLKDPRILILDEATSALDTHSERLVQAALEPLIKRRTTIAIAHRLSTILAADRIMYMDRGRIIERGSHEELLALGGAYAALYREQFSGGKVETRCEDGLVLASGEVVPQEPA